MYEIDKPHPHFREPRAFALRSDMKSDSIDGTICINAPAEHARKLARPLPVREVEHQNVGPCVAHEDKKWSMIMYDRHAGVQVCCLAHLCTLGDIIAVLKARRCDRAPMLHDGRMLLAVRRGDEVRE